MEEKKHSLRNGSACSCRLFSAVPFLLGVLAALIFGWCIFPDLLYGKEAQPFFFSHEIHTRPDKVAASCADCHSFRADGSFTGRPGLETCEGCHQEVMTTEPGESATALEKEAYEAETIFVEQYVREGREVPWALHQKQPDNVFFSHAAHFHKCYACHLTMKAELSLGSPGDPEKLCRQCHPSLNELDGNPFVESNVLTGYGRATMKMGECEHCHANPGHFYSFGKGRTAANNACFTCHK